MITIEWGAQRVINLYTAWRKQLVQILKSFGMRSIKELVGRTDCLYHLDYQREKDEGRRAVGGGN
jgi:glutamate synthase domain-containing protein 2